jgi:uncharacterized protein (DUF302 family)
MATNKGYGSQPPGVTVHASGYSVKETISRIGNFLKQQGVTIYARIDQQNEVEKNGGKLAPLEFLLFGNPKGGGPVMQEKPIAALDLPLKVIAWEDEQGKVWVAYNQAEYIKDRYGLSTETSAKLNLDGAIAKALV